MSKRKRKHSSKQRTLKKSKDNSSDSKRSIGSKLRMFGKIFMPLLALLLALWGGYLTLKPSINVRLGDAYDSNNPVTIPFIIKNQGNLPIYNVESSSSMNIIKLSGNITVIAEVPFANSFSDPKQVAKIIAPGEEFTIVLPYSHMKNNKFEESDIAIRLKFNPVKWLPWPYETTHRFESAKNKDGQWKWYPQPIDK